MNHPHIHIDPEQAEVRSLLSLSGSLVGKRILEVGCGNGRLTWLYAHLAQEVVAIDPNKERIAAAIDQIPAKLADRVQFQTADILTLEPTEPFDLVLLSWSL